MCVRVCVCACVCLSVWPWAWAWAWACGCGCVGVMQAMAHLRYALKRNDNDLAKALDSAVEKAINSNDGDNCTAILIAFHKVLSLLALLVYLLC